MRRLMSIGTAVILSMSITACATSNRTAKNNTIINRTTSEEQITPRYSLVTNTRTYKDGVYRGEGNKNSNGNEVAIVHVTNGKVSNVDLISVDTNGNVKYDKENTKIDGNYNTTEINNITGNTSLSGTNRDLWNRDNNLNGLNATPNVNVRNNNLTNPRGTGTTIGGTDPRLVGGTNNGMMNGTTNSKIAQYPAKAAKDDYEISNARININDVPSQYSTGGNGNELATRNINNISNSLAQARTTLINSIIQTNNYNVDTIATDGTTTNTLNNWKLAVQRALDQAAR